jgi:hypothetical protein
MRALESLSKRSISDAETKEHGGLDEALKFADNALANAHVWNALPVVDKQRFQSALFPAGVLYASGGLGIPENSLFSVVFIDGGAEKASLVDQTLPQWNQIAAWLVQVDALRGAA